MYINEKLSGGRHWSRLRLGTSQRLLPGFDSQANSQILCYIRHCIEKKDENKEKQSGFGTNFLTKKLESL